MTNPIKQTYTVKNISCNYPAALRILLLLFISFIFSHFDATAQIGIGINPPDSSAMLHVQDTTRGLLIPRMTAVQRNAIHHPAEGLMVYQLDSVTGFWYFSDGSWDRILPEKQNKNFGRQTIILSDDITNAEAQAKIAAEAGPNTQIIRIVGCTQLTSVDLSAITKATEIYIYDDSVLQTINFPDLKSVEGFFYVEKCPKLTALNVPVLERLFQGGQSQPAFKIINTSLPSLAMPVLKKISGNYTVEANYNLTSFTLPFFAEYGISTNITVTKNPVIITVSFPTVVKTYDINITENKLFTTLSVPALSECNSITVGKCHSITSVSLPALNKGSIAFTGDSSLTNISVPLFATGSINLTSDSSLVSVTFPAFANGNLVLANSNPILASVLFPVLTTCNSFSFGANPITSIALPALTSVKVLYVASALFTTLNLPVLNNIGETFTFFRNDNLQNLNLPALASCGDIFLGPNIKMLSASFPVLTSSGNITIFSREDSLLASLSFPLLVNAKNIQVSNHRNLANFILPELVTVSDASISISGSLSLPKLTTTGNLYLYATQPSAFVVPVLQTAKDITFSYDIPFTSISFPVLKTMGKFDISKPIGNSLPPPSPAITALNFPQLLNAGEIFLSGASVSSLNAALLNTVTKRISFFNMSISGFSLPSLATIGSINIGNCSSITSIDFPLLTSLTDSTANTNFYTGATSVNLGNLSTFKNFGFSFYGKLPSSGVNYLLNKFVSITPPVANNYFSFTQSPAAPPTGQGLIDKATLIARPNNVTTD